MLIKAVRFNLSPLGTISSTALMGKEMQKQARDLKLPWDSELATFLLKNWIK